MSENLQNRDQTLAYLAATGLTNAQIAESLGLDPKTVRLKLTDERIAFEIKHLRYKLYGADHKKRFNDILPHALDVTEEIVRNPNISPKLKFAAAQEVFDRALGKPKQTVEHEGSLIRALFEKLDAQKSTPVIDVGKETVIENPNERINLPTQANPNRNMDTVEDWISKNI